MEQKILYKVGELSEIIGDKFFLLVRGSNSYNSLGVKDFFDQFKHVEFSSFTSNPLYEQVEEGVRIFKENDCQLIVAVGGGSAIDVAKCIKLFCTMDLELGPYLMQECKQNDVDLIAIPTTAGTGSESTKHAVIYYDGKKQSISSNDIIPKVAVLDGSLLNNLSDFQKKCTLLDALSQAIESWWSVNSNDESIEYSKKSIKAIKDNWEEYIFKNSCSAAEEILIASNYAGKAINITATTAAHAMSYKITSMYKLPHGYAVAICLPVVWDNIINNIDKCSDYRGKKHLIETMNEIEKYISLDDFKEMLRKMGIVYPKSERKFIDVNILTEAVNAIRLKNNPVYLDKESIRKMYERIIL